MRRAAFIVLAAGLLAGCGGSSKPKVVAWKAAPLPSPAPASRACNAADLRATPLLNSSTGGLTGVIRFSNASPTPCRLLGIPKVKLQPALPQSVSALASAPSGLPGSWLGALGGNRQAMLPITLFNWCYPPKTTTLVFTLPGGGGKLSVPLHEAPRCIVPATATTISLAPFIPAAGSGTEEARPLSATIVPSQLEQKPGTVLRYRVDLTNTSKSTYSFTDCPLIRQALLQASVARVDVLNCRPAGDIKPGHTESFQMQLVMPPSSAHPTDTLAWSLDPFSPRPVQATAKVTAG